MALLCVHNYEVKSRFCNTNASKGTWYTMAEVSHSLRGRYGERRRNKSTNSELKFRGYFHTNFIENVLNFYRKFTKIESATNVRQINLAFL